MNITLSVETYKGVDGSSLSSTRCDQIVQVYEMLELFGSKSLTYIDIQEEAQKRKLFGETNAKSAIRTFFPLLEHRNQKHQALDNLYCILPSQEFLEFVL